MTAAVAGRADHPLYATYGLIVATFLGTMGLPHVVVRFYTSPNGRAARRTTVVVLALIGAFYLLPPVYGALGRLYVPELPSARTPTPPSCCCRSGRSADSAEICSARWSRAGPSPRFSPRPPG